MKYGKVKKMMEAEVTNLRVYYDDTDAGGVVYYANYLRYLEVARTEYLRERNLSLREYQDQGYLFPVVHLEIEYRVPAVYDDIIRVHTRVRTVDSATFTLAHRLIRLPDGTLLTEGMVALACLGPAGKVRRLPAELRRILEEARSEIDETFTERQGTGP